MRKSPFKLALIIYLLSLVGLSNAASETHITKEWLSQRWLQPNEAVTSTKLKELVDIIDFSSPEASLKTTLQKLVSQDSTSSSLIFTTSASCAEGQPHSSSYTAKPGPVLLRFKATTEIDEQTEPKYELPSSHQTAIPYERIEHDTHILYRQMQTEEICLSTGFNRIESALMLVHEVFHYLKNSTSQLKIPTTAGEFQTRIQSYYLNQLNHEVETYYLEAEVLRRTNENLKSEFSARSPSRHVYDLPRDEFVNLLENRYQYKKHILRNLAHEITSWQHINTYEANNVSSQIAHLEELQKTNINIYNTNIARLNLSGKSKGQLPEEHLKILEGQEAYINSIKKSIEKLQLRLSEIYEIQEVLSNQLNKLKPASNSKAHIEWHL